MIAYVYAKINKQITIFISVCVAILFGCLTMAIDTGHRVPQYVFQNSAVRPFGQLLHQLRLAHLDFACEANLHEIRERV